MANVLLGCPLYDDRLGSGPSKAFWREATRKHRVVETTPARSLIDLNCTKIWCDALNNRDTVNYMAILHHDITPQAWWLDTLIEQVEQHRADFVSGGVALSGSRGVCHWLGQCLIERVETDLGKGFPTWLPTGGYLANNSQLVRGV